MHTMIAALVVVVFGVLLLYPRATTPSTSAPLLEPPIAANVEEYALFPSEGL